MHRGATGALEPVYVLAQQCACQRRGMKILENVGARREQEKKRKDYAGQVWLRALRKGPLTSKLANRKTGKIMYAMRTLPTSIRKWRHIGSKSRGSPQLEGKRKASVGLVGLQACRLAARGPGTPEF
eukprot:1161803-Pelagomonas_calceolata.AAC.15